MAAHQRLWTIQPAEVWDALRTEGVVYVDPGKIPHGFVNREYQWLSRQLARRLPGWKGLPPWWFYCRRPDLRAHRHLQRGHQVLFEVSPPPGTYLSFPCWAWGEIFGGRYLSMSREEDQQWQRRVAGETGLPEGDAMWSDFTPGLRREVRTSWQRLFDPLIPARSWRRGWTSTTREAVMESISMDWVRRAKAFKGVRVWTW